MFFKTKLRNLDGFEVGKRGHKYLIIVRLSVVLVGIVFAVLWLRQGQRLERMAAIFRQMSVWRFGLAFCVFAISQLIIAYRWRLLLKTQQVWISFGAAVRLHLLGLFYNNFMPGSVGGDLLRAWYVTKHTDRKFEAALSVFVDRVIGLLSTLVIATVCYLLFLRDRTLSIVVRPAADLGRLLAKCGQWGVIVLAGAAVVGAVVVVLHGGIRSSATAAGASIAAPVARLWSKFRTVMGIYCSRPVVLGEVFLLTVVLQVAMITGFWFLGVELGVDVSVRYYYVFFTLAWVLGSVPISVGGAVIVEGLLAYLFVTFASVQPEAAVALALCQRLIWMIASLPGAAIHLIGAHLPKEFFVDGKFRIV